MAPIFALLLIIFLGWLILKINQEVRLHRKMNKVVEPQILRKIVNELWSDADKKISSQERNKAKAWIDESLRRIDAREIRTAAELEKTLPKTFMEYEIEGSNGSKPVINSKSIKKSTSKEVKKLKNKL